jgi:hypothetical protein
MMYGGTERAKGEAKAVLYGGIEQAEAEAKAAGI